MGHATVDDVETVLLRGLNDPESELAKKLVDVAAGMLRARIPELDDRMASDSDFAARVNYVEANAVARVLRNPDGVTYETIGPYAAQLGQQSGGNGISFTAGELGSLGVGGGAFTIRPFLAAPTLPAAMPPPWMYDFPPATEVNP